MALALWTFGSENGETIAFLTHESIDQEARTILQGTMRAVPYLARMNSRFQTQISNAPRGPKMKEVLDRTEFIYEEVNIVPQIGQAIVDYVQLKREGISISDRLAQSGFEGFGTELDPVEAEILKMFDQFKRSAVKISRVFTEYVRSAALIPNPLQGAFGTLEEMEDERQQRIEPGDALVMLRRAIKVAILSEGK